MSKVLLCYEDFSELTSMQSILQKIGFDVLPITSEFALAQQILHFNPDIVVGYGRGPKVTTVGIGRRLKEMSRWNGRVVLVFPAGSKPQPSELAAVRMDMALEAPLEITRLVQVLANLSNQDPQTLIEKMLKTVAEEAKVEARAGWSEKVSDAVFVTGSREEVPQWNVQGSVDADDFDRLMGKSSESKAPMFPLAPQAQEEEAPSLVSSVRTMLDEAQRKVADKVRGYAKFLQPPSADQPKALRRTETRKVQKELEKEWSESALKNQDELRREFTGALFKKKD